MQPALSVDQPGPLHSGNHRAGRRVDFSLFFDGDDPSFERGHAAIPACGDAWQQLLLKAVSFADAHDFRAVWPPSESLRSCDAGAAIAPQPSLLQGATKRVVLRAVGSFSETTATAVQSPVWIAAGEDPDLFKAAAQAGAAVLTRLLGRSIESVEKDVALYRRTWSEAGVDGDGYVTLVVPTLVGEDSAVVNQLAHAAMRDRLRQEPSLLREAAWEFPAFAKASEESGATLDDFVATCSSRQLEELSQFAAEMYVATSGLFGGLSRCLALVERLKQVGVDEIACLLNFGLPGSVWLEHLPALNELRRAFNLRDAVNTQHHNNRAGVRANGHPAEPVSAVQIHSPAPRPSTAPRTQTQQGLAELWQRLLDVPEVGADDNFFDLGGHSLLAARAVSEIERAFGARIPIKTLMVSSLHQLAADIDRFAADRPTADRCDEARREATVRKASASRENSHAGLLSSWFKNTRNADRFQDGVNCAE